MLAVVSLSPSRKLRHGIKQTSLLTKAGGHDSSAGAAGTSHPLSLTVRHVRREPGGCLIVSVAHT